MKSAPTGFTIGLGLLYKNVEIKVSQFATQLTQTDEGKKELKARELRRIRQFYEIFSNPKLTMTWSKLTLSYYIEEKILTKYNNILKRKENYGLL